MKPAQTPFWRRPIVAIPAVLLFICVLCSTIISNISPPPAPAISTDDSTSPVTVVESVTVKPTKTEVRPSATTRPTSTTRASRTPTVSPSPTAVTHTVQPGETLGIIAREYNTTVAALIAANNLDAPDSLRVGQELIIRASQTGEGIGEQPTQQVEDTVSSPTPGLTETAVTTIVSSPTSEPTIAIAVVNTATSAPQPTAPPLPTNTSIPLPTDTPIPLPTNTPVPIPTNTPLPAPTSTPAPPPPPAPSQVIISYVLFDGAVSRVESDEYAVITNNGGASVNLSGWFLNAGDNGQNFYFPNFDLAAGASCRVYTNEFHSDWCGFSFGSGRALWNNDGDCGYLIDSAGTQVSQYCY